MGSGPLDTHRDAIAGAVADRLSKRSGSVFSELGREACLRHTSAAIDALIADLAVGKNQSVRTFVYPLVEELTASDATYSDFRSFCQFMRRKIREALDAEDTAVGGEVHAAIETWFYELLLASSVRFMAWRDEVHQRAASKSNVTRLESQLDELEKALAERTQLADLIRKASIPIVPVVKGILVVPLIGTFDSQRAVHLGESLLNEVARTRARAAIIDISGVPLFDTAAAQMIISLARSVELLGSRIYLVGMSPDNARTIVQLGIELDKLQTFSNLQDGLAWALRRQGLEIRAVSA